MKKKQKVVKVQAKRNIKSRTGVTIRKVGKVTYRMHTKKRAADKPTFSVLGQTRQRKAALGRLNAQVNEQSSNLLRLTRSIEERNDTLKNLGELFTQTTQKTEKLLADYGTLRGRAIGLAAQLIEVADNLREAADINDLTLTQITTELLLTEEDPMGKLLRATEAELDEDSTDVFTNAIDEELARSIQPIAPEPDRDTVASYFDEEEAPLPDTLLKEVTL